MQHWYSNGRIQEGFQENFLVLVTGKNGIESADMANFIAYNSQPFHELLHGGFRTLAASYEVPLKRAEADVVLEQALRGMPQGEPILGQLRVLDLDQVDIMEIDHLFDALCKMSIHERPLGVGPQAEWGTRLRPA